MTKSELTSQDRATLLDLVTAQALPSQRDAITSDKKLTVVSAGAGTGKTWTLAWRFIWCALMEDDAPSVLTLTFTEKAAGEMRQRIADLLAELKNTLPQGTLRERAQSALASLDRCSISTIHSFSMKALREAGLSLPMDPSRRIISTPEEEDFWEQCSQALERRDAAWFRLRVPPHRDVDTTKLQSDDWSLLIDAFRANGLITFARSFIELESSRGRNADDLWELAEPQKLNEATEQLLGTFKSRTSDLIAPWEKVFQNVVPDDSTAFGQNLTQLTKLYAELGQSETAQSFLIACHDLIKGARGKLADQVAQVLGQKITDYRKTLESWLPLLSLQTDGWQEAELALRQQLMQMACLCWYCWERHKDRLAVFSFSDLIVKARQLAEKDEQYCQRFRHVLVDEYQDTDGLQDQMISQVAQAAHASLFLVGDIKQSIYGFRHAEPSLLDRKAQEAKHRDDGCYVALQINFRSCDTVLDGVNQRFARIWRHGIAPSLNSPCEPLLSPGNLAPQSPKHLARQTVSLPLGEVLTEPPGDMTTDARREHLYEALALRLTQLKSQEALVWDKEQKKPRSLRFGDVTILVPTRSSYGPLRRAFMKQAVPLILESSVDYYARYEVRDLISLLSWIARGDRLSLASFLASPLSGLELAEAQNLIDQLKEDDPLACLEKLYPLLASKLKTWRNRAAFCGTSQTAGQLLQSSSLLLSQILPRKRFGVVANLRQCIHLLEDFEAALGTSPHSAADYLNRSADRSIRHTAAPESGQRDAVRAMTVHAAKGLEFPFVVLAGMEHQPGNRNEALTASRWLGATASQWPDDQDGQPRLKALHKLLEQGSTQEEQQRLFYVALTRARDGFMFCGLLNEEPKPWSDTSWFALEDPDVTQQNPIEIEEDKPRHITELEPQGPTFNVATHRAKRLLTISATSHIQWHFCPALWRYVWRQGMKPSWHLPGLETEGVARWSGAPMGELLHWLLEHWDFSPLSLPHLLNHPSFKPPLHLMNLWRRPDVGHQLRQWAENLLTLPSSSRLVEASAQNNLKREQPLRLDIPQGVAMTGVADLLWTEQREGQLWFCVRDYKTTRLSASQDNNALVHMAARQLQFYGALLRQSEETRQTRLDLAIYALHEAQEIAVEEPSLHQDEKLIETVIKQSTQAATGPWHPNTANCPTCPFATTCQAKSKNS